MKECIKLEQKISQTIIRIKIGFSKYLKEGFPRFKIQLNIKKTSKRLMLIKAINSLTINTKKVFTQILTEKFKINNRIKK